MQGTQRTQAILHCNIGIPMCFRDINSTQAAGINPPSSPTTKYMPSTWVFNVPVVSKFFCDFGTSRLTSRFDNMFPDIQRAGRAVPQVTYYQGSLSCLVAWNMVPHFVKHTPSTIKERQQKIVYSDVKVNSQSRTKRLAVNLHS